MKFRLNNSISNSISFNFKERAPVIAAKSTGKTGNISKVLPVLTLSQKYNWVIHSLFPDWGSCICFLWTLPISIKNVSTTDFLLLNHFLGTSRVSRYFKVGTHFAESTSPLQILFTVMTSNCGLWDGWLLNTGYQYRFQQNKKPARLLFFGNLWNHIPERCFQFFPMNKFTFLKPWNQLSIHQNLLQIESAESNHGVNPLPMFENFTSWYYNGIPLVLH